MMNDQFFEKKHRMGKWKFILIPVGIAAFLTVFSFAVMLLWNNLMPDIFHLTTITFWQAMGLLVLCKILFGFGKPGGGGWRGGQAPWMKHKMAEKLKHMSPEQKEQFKKQMRDRMCDFRGRRWDNFDWEQPHTEEKGAPEKQTE
ncbi:hypothetical protein MUY27_03735 [Mucilaginibacter sp. RS28]|uniref:DUF1682 domain-containing protein n=1 Tax=Mucilaginibacter straminoryzae TaxID=2932774 RepID=A0A9X1X1U6_9SPHI|nr:hypothetical protein [Mucilaginibacter straminoryzae]MCJ8208805.1 hypothetical protein [Mucilaginibacter straminoryzae]